MNDHVPQGRRRGRPPLVTTERIIDAGIALTLPALSMRGVAEALGISEMTLYRHVDNLAGLRRTVAQGIWRARTSRNRTPQTPVGPCSSSPRRCAPWPRATRGIGSCLLNSAVTVEPTVSLAASATSRPTSTSP